jgi:hypothetical protein
MKKYIALLQSLVWLSPLKNPQASKKCRPCLETRRAAKEYGGSSQLDIPTYIRQGRVLSIN